MVLKCDNYLGVKGYSFNLFLSIKKKTKSTTTSPTWYILQGGCHKAIFTPAVSPSHIVADALYLETRAS